MCEWLSSREWCDVQLLCEGGVLSAHRAVLASVSSFLRAVLLSCPEDDSIYIVLPEFNFETMKSVLNYIYTGEVTINKSEVDMFTEIINAMKIYIDIEYRQILNSSASYKYITGDTNNTFQNKIQNDVCIKNAQQTKNILLHRQDSTTLDKQKLCRNWSKQRKPLENLQSLYGYRQRNFFLRDSFIETYPQNGNVNGLREAVPAISNEHYHAPTSFPLTNTNGNDLRTEDKLSNTSKISGHAIPLPAKSFYFDSDTCGHAPSADGINTCKTFLNSPKVDNWIDLMKSDNLKNLWIKHYPLQKMFSLADSAEIKRSVSLDSNSLDLRLYHSKITSSGNSQKAFKGKPQNITKSLVQASSINLDRKPMVRHAKQKAIKTILNKVLENPWCPRLPKRNIWRPSDGCLDLKAKTTTLNNDKNNNTHANFTQDAKEIIDRTKTTTTETEGPLIKLSVNPCSPTTDDLKCNICNQILMNTELLQEHNLKKHPCATKYKCSECGKTFSQPRNFKYHMSVHRGTREFAATCTVCGKYFNDRGYLSSHMKIHRNRKEYKCSMCPKSFNQRVAYNMHMRIHTGEKPHVCEECGKAFSRKMLLRQHQRTHSGERPYGCPHCDKRFADRSNMTLHLRLHTGVKPFSCSLCPKSFTKKHHLKSHLNFHTGDKPYSCPRCKLGFTQSSNMRTHLKKCNASEHNTCDKAL